LMAGLRAAIAQASVSDWSRRFLTRYRGDQS
jgi:hypothetical protein